MNNEALEELKIFAEESDARLERIHSALQQLTHNTKTHKEAVNALFRETHTLKSAANLLDIKPVEKLAHKLEEIIELLRNGEERADAQLVAILSAGYVRIGQLLENPQVLLLIDTSQEIAGIARLLSQRTRSQM